MANGHGYLLKHGLKNNVFREELYAFVMATGDTARSITTSINNTWESSVPSSELPSTEPVTHSHPLTELDPSKGHWIRVIQKS